MRSIIFSFKWSQIWAEFEQLLFSSSCYLDFRVGWKGFWEMGECGPSLRSGTDVGRWARGPDSQSAFQFLSNGLGGVRELPLCMLAKFIHTRFREDPLITFATKLEVHRMSIWHGINIYLEWTNCNNYYTLWTYCNIQLFKFTLCSYNKCK